MSAIRVAIRASRLERPAWQADLIARLRELPGVDVVETFEARLLQPADLLIDPTEGALAPGGPLHPPLGVWRLIYGAEGRLTTPGLVEHASGERGVMARLVSVDANGKASLLETGMFRTVAHSLSATRARMFGAIAEWPARALRRVLAAESALERGGHVTIAPWPQGAMPTPGQWPRGAIRNYGRRIAHELVEEHWTLGVIRKPVAHVIDSFDANQIDWLTFPPGMVIADPAGALERGGRTTILAEAYDFEDRRGRIVAMAMENARIVSAPREVLRLPVHVSYPHLIAHAGQIYCLPEASATRRVQLFRADPFPDRWVPDRILLNDFAGADATVYCYGGRWWMFTGNHEDQDEAKLFLFHADRLFGPWQPHPLNPVKCDLRSARPAGPLFEHKGSLYRPAQDGSRTYGGAVAINRIVALSITEFAEETINVLRPAPSGPCPDGLHTLLGVGDLTLVDGKRHARSFKRLAWGLKQLARQRARPRARNDGSTQIR